MNRLACLAVFLFCSIFAFAQQAKYIVTYASIIDKTVEKGIGVQGDFVLLVKDVPADKASSLECYIGSNTVTGSFNTAAATKSFPVPAGTTGFKLKYSSTPGATVDFMVRSEAGSATKNLGGVASDITGVAFYDAALLYNQLESGSCSQDFIDRILAVYQLAGSDPAKNPFFARIGGLNCAAYTRYRTALHGNNDGIGKFQNASGLIGALGGVDVTKYVQAFADFLRDRMKEELTVAFAEKLRAEIRNTPELQYLLPKTYQVFNTSEVLNTPSMGPAYRAAFAEDLQNMLPNFRKMVYSLDAYSSLRDNERFIAFLVAFNFADLSAKGYHPIDIMRQLSDDYGYMPDSSGRNKTMNYTLSLMNALTRNLRNPANNCWIDKADFKLFDTNFLWVFIGLIYEQNPALFQSDDPHAKQVLNWFESRNTAVDKLYNLLVIGNNIDERLKDWKEWKLNAGADTSNTALSYFLANADDIFQLMDYVVKISARPEIVRVYNDTLREALRQSVEVAKAVQSKDVGKVVVYSLGLIQFVAGDSLMSADVIQKLTFYTNFIADMAAAGTAADAKAVLTKYAAPPHSYRVVRKSQRSVTLAAYPGIYVGAEKSFSDSKTGAGAFGVTAPIGFSFNWGRCKGRKAKDEAMASHSLFVSLVDIGAALSFRWQNDSIDLPQKVTLSQIFSPGLFYVHGWKNSPMACKFGFQYAPALRQIKDGQQTVADNIGVWRVSLGLSVDIPVFLLSRK